MHLSPCSLIVSGFCQPKGFCDSIADLTALLGRGLHACPWSCELLLVSLEVPGPCSTSFIAAYDKTPPTLSPFCTALSPPSSLL